MNQARKGSTVKIRYTGRLGNGEIFDLSNSLEPLEFIIGSGEVLEALENGIIGMEPGEIKKILVLAKEGYGPRCEELITNVKKNDLPENITPAIGKRLEMKKPNGDPIIGIVTAMNEERITLDTNHPLAGEALIFDVELVEVV